MECTIRRLTLLLLGVAPGVLACSSPTEDVGPGAVVVASVSLTPDSTDVVAGATTSFTATPRDLAGQPLSGRAVAWQSSNELVGTITPPGVATGVAPGVTTVSATSEGRRGTARLRVVAAPGGGAVTECATPAAAWIWCDDFEQDRLASYFEVDGAGGRFARMTAVGRSGSFGMRARWTAGVQSAGALHLAFGLTPQAYMRPVDAGTARYREIYWRFFVRRQAGWTGGGGDKLTRAHIFASASSFAQAMAAHVWSGMASDANYLTIDPASGTDANGTLVATTYNDPNFRWLGAVRGPTAMFGAGAADVWQCVESRVLLNDAGQSNGRFDVWLDGAVEITKTGMNWVGAYSAFGINAIYVENYWNAGSPVQQDRFFDNFVVSTQRIGC